jgi:ferredoxin
MNDRNKVEDYCMCCCVCMETCPEVFEMNEAGVMQVKFEEIPAKLEKKVLKAIELRGGRDYRAVGTPQAHSRRHEEIGRVVGSTGFDQGDAKLVRACIFTEPASYLFTRFPRARNLPCFMK